MSLSETRKAIREATDAQLVIWDSIGHQHRIDLDDLKELEAALSEYEYLIKRVREFGILSRFGEDLFKLVSREDPDSAEARAASGELGESES